MNNIKLVFVSNYYNHHQKYLSDAFYEATNGSYYFIETEVISEERLNMGWGKEKKPSYVKQNYISKNDRNVCQKIIDIADIVIMGSAPEVLLKDRKFTKKLIFRYSERPLKKGLQIWKYPYRFFTWHSHNFRKKNIYILCASAYTAVDYEKFGLFEEKCYKWGYFPEVKQYQDIQKLLGSKKKNSILWAGRFLDWKHPELPIKIAKRLKDNGYSFEMNLIGDGELKDKIQLMITEYKLSDYVYLRGVMKPEQVREYMEQSQLYLFTSDRNEGWGAVLNESMNSACAVVASHAVGSVPFLLKDGENGFIYKDGDEEDFYQKIKRLLDNIDLSRQFGVSAYKTMIDIWNPKTAAERFLKLAERILDGEKNPDIFESGVCSRADKIEDD